MAENTTNEIFFGSGTAPRRRWPTPAQLFSSPGYRQLYAGLVKSLLPKEAERMLLASGREQLKDAHISNPQEEKLVGIYATDAGELCAGYRWRSAAGWRDLTVTVPSSAMLAGDLPTRIAELSGFDEREAADVLGRC